MAHHVRKFVDLIFCASNLYSNWEPSHPIRVGEYGVLNTETAEFEREGNIYDDPDFADMVRNKPPEPIPTEDRIILTSNHVRNKQLDISGHRNAKLADVSFKAGWNFGRHAAAAMIALSPRIESLNTRLDITPLLEHPKLEGKHIIKEVTTCRKYVYFFSEK
ncbi:hypothetical protein FRB99_008066, partial [Tulasnella sp. 403]